MFQVNFRLKPLKQIKNIHILNLKNNFALFTMQVEKYFALSTILFIAFFHPSSLIHVPFKTEKSFYYICFFFWKYIYRLVSLQLQCSMKKHISGITPCKIGIPSKKAVFQLFIIQNKQIRSLQNKVEFRKVNTSHICNS